MTHTALLVRTDGTTEEFDLYASGDPLEILRRKIGCEYVDAIRLGPFSYVWVDEDPWLAAPNPPENDYAVPLVIAATHSVLGRYLYGNVVFTGGADENGDTVGLTAGQLAHLNQSLAEVRDVIATEPDRRKKP